jgi:hypothetical protein
MRLFTAAIMAALATIAWMSPAGMRTDADIEDAGTDDAGVEDDASAPEPTEDGGDTPDKDAAVEDAE